MIDFPDSPSVDDVFTYGSLSWVWDGEKWKTAAAAAIAPQYVIGCFVPGVPGANQVLLLHPLSEDITIPADFGDWNGYSSEARGSAAATASTIVKVRRALAASPGTFTDVGAITFAAAAVVGTLSTSGVDVDFAAGDTLALVAPTTPDTTFAGFAATLVGHKS